MPEVPAVVKITLAQLNPKVGDFDRNLEKALKALNTAKADKADLIVFPELYLMGYPPQDLLERRWFIKHQEQALKALANASKNFSEIGIIVGAALKNKREPGRGLYNSAVLVHNGQVVYSQAKSLLPTYDVFDEDRYFDTASKVKPVPFQDESLGLCVCEDAWNDPDLWLQQQLYDLDPLSNLHEMGAGVIINISASPFHTGKDEIRFRLIHNHAKRLGVPLVFVNQVGGNDELIFDGRSMVLDKKGHPVALFPAFEEHVETVDITQTGTKGMFRPQDPVESVRQALVLGIRDYLGKSGFSRAVVGLSGGIDSAVTFALAAEALGRGNVLGVSMPSMHSSTGSVEDSRVLAANLDTDFRVVPIKGIYDAYMAELADHFTGLPLDVTEENIQARIRGNILMAISNKFGHLVLATGNKSEMAMGYCTLYGDMSGGLAVLSDVPKTMVYQLADHINTTGEIIPRAIIEKAPSAELRPDQKDQDTLPPYDVLDRVLQLHVEDGFSGAEIIDQGFDPEMVRFVVGTINRNEYKRKQAPPGLKVTSKAFGIGRRMPLVAKHDM
jgi:NAD+ synthase (glutamine-hydrolysing)